MLIYGRSLKRLLFLGIYKKTYITILSQYFCTNLLERLDKNIFIWLYVNIVLYKKRKVKEKGIGIEMCPISNLQTKAVKGTEEYPIREFLNAGLLVTVNTDNRTVSGTSMTKELDFIQKTYGISDEEILLLLRNAVETSFTDDDMKRRLYRQLNGV